MVDYSKLLSRIATGTVAGATGLDLYKNPTVGNASNTALSFTPLGVPMFLNDIAKWLIPETHKNGLDAILPHSEKLGFILDNSLQTSGIPYGNDKLLPTLDQPRLANQPPLENSLFKQEEINQDFPEPPVLGKQDFPINRDFPNISFFDDLRGQSVPVSSLLEEVLDETEETEEEADETEEETDEISGAVPPQNDPIQQKNWVTQRPTQPSRVQGIGSRAMEHYPVASLLTMGLQGLMKYKQEEKYRDDMVSYNNYKNRKRV